MLEKQAYELSFLIKDETVAAEISKIMRRHGAEVVSEQLPKKMDLAYKIKKEGHAFFGYFCFHSTAADAKLLEHDLGTNPAVLRFLIIRLPRKRYIAFGGELPMQKAKPVAVPREIAGADKRPIQPISNEALEKKIEEILQ